jgi:hypothetical protein
MAILGLELVTLADVAKNKDSVIGNVAEVLTQQNPMLLDIPYMEMNEGTIHKEEIRSALPEVYYRKANQGIPGSKSTTEERTFGATHFESKSQIDTAVASRGGKDRIAYNRWNQATGHIQAHGIEHANLTVYGSPVDANMKTAGLFDIYSTVDTSAEETAKQVIDAGGTGSDNCSMLKVHWGPQSVFGIYPKGSQAGLQRIDRSPGNKEIQIPCLDSNGNPSTFWGFEENFMIDHGLVVKDYRQAGRICNIDVPALISGSGAADILDLAISLNFKIDNLKNGQGVWYVNRTLYAHMYKQALNKVSAGGGLTFGNYQGEQVLMLFGDPVRLVDALLNTEARVV